MTAASPRVPSVLLRNRDIPIWPRIRLGNSLGSGSRVLLTSRGSLPSTPSSCRNPCSPLGLCVFFCTCSLTTRHTYRQAQRSIYSECKRVAYSSLRVASGYGGHGWYSLLTIFKSPGFSSMGTLVVTMSPSSLLIAIPESTAGRRRDPPREIS